MQQDLVEGRGGIVGKNVGCISQWGRERDKACLRVRGTKEMVKLGSSQTRKTGWWSCLDWQMCGLQHEVSRFMGRGF